MSAPARTTSSPLPAVAGAADAVGRPRPRGARFGGLVDVWLRSHTILIYLFLYIPIVVVVVLVLLLS